MPSAAASGNVSSARSTVWSHSNVSPLQWLRSTPAGHAGDALLVLEGAVGVRGVLEHDRAEPELEQADGGLRDADVGLEPGEHGGAPAGRADRGHGSVVRGEAERRLLDHRRARRQPDEDPRVGVAVALRPFLDDDRGDAEQRGQARHPRDPRDGRRGALRVVRGEPVGRSEEAGLRVDDDEDAVVAVDQRH